jgi:hypothetical protein
MNKTNNMNKDTNVHLKASHIIRINYLIFLTNYKKKNSFLILHHTSTTIN